MSDAAPPFPAPGHPAATRGADRPAGAAAPAADVPVTIWHNPACGTSRNALALIRAAGIEPAVIEYLRDPPGRGKLVALLAAMDMPARALLRSKGTPYDELGLGDPKWSDDELVDFMVAHPLLMNRPVVETPLGTRLCRPSETVLDILPVARRGADAGEDGGASGGQAAPGDAAG